MLAADPAPIRQTGWVPPKKQPLPQATCPAEAGICSPAVSTGMRGRVPEKGLEGAGITGSQVARSEPREERKFLQPPGACPPTTLAPGWSHLPLSLSLPVLCFFVGFFWCNLHAVKHTDNYIARSCFTCICTCENTTGIQAESICHHRKFLMLSPCHCQLSKGSCPPVMQMPLQVLEPQKNSHVVCNFCVCFVVCLASVSMRPIHVTVCTWGSPFSLLCGR